MTESTDKTETNEDIVEWEIPADRHYTLTSTTFTKRQLRQRERYTNYKGELVTIPWSRERLENERDALLFISQNTTIRVPRFLSFSVEGDVASVTMEAVDGEVTDELAKILSKEDQETLNTNVLLYINHTVLPQLTKLRSSALGSLRGDLVPPYRLQDKDGRTHWPSKK